MNIRSGTKKYIILEIVLGILVIVLAGSMLFQNKEKEFYKVAVVLPDSDSRQWSSLKYGLRMASEDCDAKMVVISTDDIASMEDEAAMIQFAIKKGADAVIVKPIPGADSEELLQTISEKIPVMLIGSSAGYNRSQSAYATTEADAAALVKQLVQEVLKDYGGDIRGKTFGIFSSDVASDVTYVKKGVVCSELERMGAQIDWKLTGNLNEDGLTILEKQKPVDVVLTLDDRSVVQAGTCSKENRLHGADVYGIGNSTESVYYLDNGSVKCLVVPDEFGAGYQCMTQVVHKLNGDIRKMEDQTVQYTVIRRSELFSERNQELLFIMSQ